VALPLCQPKLIQIQIHSHGINRHRRQHSWELIEIVAAVNTSHLVIKSITTGTKPPALSTLRFNHTVGASLVHSIHFHRCCFLLLLFVLSQQMVFLRLSFTLHNLPWPYGIVVVFFLTKQSSSNSLLRSIGRSKASWYCQSLRTSLLSFGSSCWYRDTQPLYRTVAHSHRVIRSPADSHHLTLWLRFAPL
jgi:hypothetical protein